MKSNGQFAGVLFTDLSLNKLAELSNSADFFGAGFAFIVGKEGKFISHPDSQYNGQPISSVFTSALKLQEGTQHTTLNGTKSLIVFSKLEDLGWHVGVALNEDIVYASVSKLRRDSIVYSLFALLIAVIALSIIIKQLMMPLNSLNDAMRDVASG